MTFDTIAVVGAGAWGAALANAAAQAGREVTLWARDPDAVDAMRRERIAPRLPGVRLADGVKPTAQLSALGEADAILLVIPAQAVRAAARTIAPHARAGRPVIACAKGIERGSGAFMTEVIAAEAPHIQACVLSGPSFADDVARGLPTAVTLAAPDNALAAALARGLGSTTFRPYHTDDVRGVEIGGAAKNVLAIACGIVAGRKLGASAAAALTTRGFAELVRFGRACGARGETLTGLSGLGDLLLTCSTPQSRNFSFGIMLGEGRPRTDGKLAEGQFTAQALADKARTLGVEMPIAAAVAEVVEGRWTVDEAIEALLTRPFRSEGA